MTAKAWCAISKAVEVIKAAQNTSEGRAQAWLIEACANRNVRSRADSILLSADELRPGALRTGSSIWRVAGPVSSVTWKNAVIDGDALIDRHHSLWDGVEISIADLQFELKRSLPAPDSVHQSTVDEARKATAGNQAVEKRIGRDGKARKQPTSDKEPILAEAQRRLAVGESIPSSIAAFARDLHNWLSEQPWAYRRPRDRKVLAASSIEEHIRPLWRKYRPD
jgi:hypothetical protein